MNRLSELKKSLRAAYSEKRRIADPALKVRIDRKICGILINSVTFRHADSLLLYSPLPGEPDMTDAAEQAFLSGKEVYFPRCVKLADGTDFLTFHRVTSLSQLSEGKFGIKEPSPDLPVFTPAGLCVCVVPGLAFDRSGHRLGYGKGYYDRFLNKYDMTKVGLCGSAFLTDSLPGGKYDVKMDMIITEKGVLAVDA